MSTISRLLPAFNRLSVQPSTLRLARSYVTKVKTLPSKTKASSPGKNATPEKKTPGKKAAAGTEKSGKTMKSSGDVKKSGKAADISKPKPKPKRLETVLTKLPVSGRSPWALFIQANKQQYYDAPREPGKKFNIADVTTELGKKWKEMPETEKKVFNELAAKDKLRSKAERDNLLASATVKDFRTENSLRRAEGKSTIKDPNAPKKPKNAFMFFSIAQREKGVEGSITEFQRHLGDEWRRMSENEKEPFLKLSQEDRARYLKEMKIYDPERFAPKVPKAEKAGKAEKGEKVGKAAPTTN